MTVACVHDCRLLTLARSMHSSSGLGAVASLCDAGTPVPPLLNTTVWLSKLQAGLMVLEEPFRGCSLFEAALFLRFCYRPRDVTPANLAAQRASLPALLRLAHKLDAGLIFKQVLEHMRGE